jgi:hypothetical protein
LEHRRREHPAAREVILDREIQVLRALGLQLGIAEKDFDGLGIVAGIEAAVAGFALRVVDRSVGDEVTVGRARDRVGKGEAGDEVAVETVVAQQARVEVVVTALALGSAGGIRQPVVASLGLFPVVAMA